jgi:hypothetical protein
VKRLRGSQQADKSSNPIEVMMRWLPLVVLSSCMHLVVAQNAVPSVPSTTPPPASPELSPQAAYEEAKRPLDITRAPYENWSDVEQNALAVAIKQASASCKARDPYQFTGEDRIAYARLCFFGEEWQPVQLAASNYIRAAQSATPADKLKSFPSLATAFDYSVQALLHLSDPSSAKGAAESMLRAVPYDDLVSEATSLTARYLQFAGSEDDALALLTERQPILLALLRDQPAPPGDSGSPAAQTLHSSLSIHVLYADAIALPALQQYANQTTAAAASFAEVEAALPVSLSPDDAILTADSRRQYLLLGAPLPHLGPYAWLLSPTFAVPRDIESNFGTATVFFLFPDWCGCVGMGSEFGPAVQRLRKNGVRFYALLAQDSAPPPPMKPAARSVRPAASNALAAKATDPVQLIHKPTAAEYLSGTATLVVPSATINTFVATDFPLIVVADYRGIVRVVQTAPQNALRPGYLVDEIADHVLKTWPPPPPR